MITKNDVLNLENQLYEAMKSNNVVMLDKLLHNDLLFIVPSGETITKEMDLETYRSGKLKIVELIPNIEQLSIIDDLAAITLKMNLKGSYDSRPIEAQYRYIRFWKNFSDGIKVVGGSGISI
ncbi:nuclear transport factor 2 family protein [Sphingobacterium sp. JB170]|uniref:nuclear transport factor 2 family protein n=1 Tax=Sphingobacterium sp. JB170 TaxID=1434842 RepID=UPI00097F0AFC|nr:nuclear transport factor 2 family protein [Sphingobacterium sp. JB170]SJN49921.1 Cytochrome P-450:NADPH-P-450 reductase [Sphingobacterium sp. JB170]